jgi:hypothetical protein
MLGTAWAAAPAPVDTGFVPEDVEVCPKEADVIDPEFNVDGSLIAFQDSAGQVKVARMNADGTVDSPGCAGEVVARNAVLTVADFPAQGPEWAYSRRGEEIYYTQGLDSGDFALAYAWHDGSAWQTAVLARGTGRGLQIVSADAADPHARTLYVGRTRSGRFRVFWRETIQPLSEARVEANVDNDVASAPRWVGGGRLFSTALQDPDGVFQAALYDVDTRSSRLLTTGPGNKDDVWLWRAPEFGGDWAMLTVVDRCCLTIYRETDGEFVPVLAYDVRQLAGLETIYSPEPAVIGDRSYIAFQAGNKRFDNKSQIWVVSADPAAPMARLVSEPGVLSVRIEPEWRVTPSGVHVYFTRYGDERRSSLRRAATGIAPPAR